MLSERRPPSGESEEIELRPQLSGPWRNPGFMKLWIGQTVSLFGSQITLLALPLVAAVTLPASPAQMGILGAAGTLPVLPIGLLAGVMADQRRRLPILIATNLGRALCLSLKPMVALTGTLRKQHEPRSRFALS
jgi:MFS family permease